MEDITTVLVSCHYPQFADELRLLEMKWHAQGHTVDPGILQGHTVGPGVVQGHTVGPGVVQGHTVCPGVI